MTKTQPDKLKRVKFFPKTLSPPTPPPHPPNTPNRAPKASFFPNVYFSFDLFCNDMQLIVKEHTHLLSDNSLGMAIGINKSDFCTELLIIWLH